MTPLRTGIALAVTVAGFYALCTVAWTLLAPATFLRLMDNTFHMDFTSMVTPRPFDWPGFFLALAVLSALALLAGMFFSWLHNRLAR